MNVRSATLCIFQRRNMDNTNTMAFENVCIANVPSVSLEGFGSALQRGTETKLLIVEINFAPVAVR